MEISYSIFLDAEIKPKFKSKLKLGKKTKKVLEILPAELIPTICKIFTLQAPPNIISVDLFVMKNKPLRIFLDISTQKIVILYNNESTTIALKTLKKFLLPKEIKEYTKEIEQILEQDGHTILF